MKFKLFLMGIMICILTGCKNKSAYTYDCDDIEYKYEIEKVFHDNVFSSILKGENVPVEIKYGMGGEGGYEQYSTKDSKMINEYIEAFKEVKIKEVITNQDDMIVIFDGIEDYIFIMEDGTEIVIGTDCSTYVRDSDIEYVLENNEKLFELNKLIRGY